MCGRNSLDPVNAKAARVSVCKTLTEPQGFFSTLVSDFELPSRYFDVRFALLPSVM